MILIFPPCTRYFKEEGEFDYDVHDDSTFNENELSENSEDLKVSLLE